MECWLFHQLFRTVVYHRWVLTRMKRCWDDECGTEHKGVIMRHHRPNEDDNFQKGNYLHDFVLAYLFEMTFYMRIKSFRNSDVRIKGVKSG
jgi:hypothetical protein